MQSVKSKPLSAYSWWMRIFFWKQKRKYGQLLEPGLVWDRSPKVFAALALLYGALDRRSSPIPPPLRSLVTVRISQINHCAFCVDINSATLQKRGISEEKIVALQDWTTRLDLYSAEEQLALRYAEAMTLNKVDDDLRAKLVAQWPPDALVELTALIAFQNLSSKFNAALDLPPQGFCRMSPSANTASIV